MGPPYRQIFDFFFIKERERLTETSLNETLYLKRISLLSSLDSRAREFNYPTFFPLSCSFYINVKYSFGQTEYYIRVAMHICAFVTEERPTLILKRFLLSIFLQYEVNRRSYVNKPPFFFMLRQKLSFSL